MITKFDVGDKIKFTVEGTVKSYSIDGNGDCYVIEIPHNSKRNTTYDAIRLYLETDALDAADAIKVNKSCS